jgi:quercetin dioxygenase-like cupin family protein
MRAAVHSLTPDSLPWEPLGSLTRKLLSKDPHTGAETNLVRIPPGWRGSGKAHYHHCYEEAFVMDGDVTLTGREDLVDGSYLYRPAGIVHGHRESARDGCRVLIKLGKTLDFNYQMPPASEDEYPIFPTIDGRGHVVHLRTPQAPVAMLAGGDAPVEAVTMSEDAPARAYSRLLRFPRAWRGELALAPEDSWEWFVARGALQVSDGTRYARDGYSFRPPGHGPAVAITGAAAGTWLLVWRNTDRQ